MVECKCTSTFQSFLFLCHDAKFQPEARAQVHGKVILSFLLTLFFFLSREKAPNRYGFVEKVVDGMFVQINSVIICFKFHAFLATFQMSRVFIQSTNPTWKPDDLRMTRVKDEVRGEVLTFKEVTWSTLRIDANALYDVRTLFSIFILFLYLHLCVDMLMQWPAGPLISFFLLLG